MRFEDNNTNNIELISAAIDNYVNLQRIKATNTCKNTELDYQLEIAEVKLSVLGVNAKDLVLNKRC